ncbi:HNH endonuclease [Flavobacterium sp.]|uniref:HNH endonuclease n=1 Tax=Flavobacterium sp. TaxID=239 RepID=UPI004033C591
MKKNAVNEQWKAIKANQNYEVSDQGRVRHHYKNGKVKVLAPLTNGQNDNDYLFVMIDSKKNYIHHLVLEAFVGEKPEGYESDHMNGKQDNRLVSLRYLTIAENRSHKGSKHGMSKLTERLVKAIKGLADMGITQKQIADLYEVSASTISSIITGKTWNHVA